MSVQKLLRVKTGWFTCMEFCVDIDSCIQQSRHAAYVSTELAKTRQNGRAAWVLLGIFNLEANGDGAR